jgi:hypothetical protein
MAGSLTLTECTQTGKPIPSIKKFAEWASIPVFHDPVCHAIFELISRNILLKL